MNTEITGEVVDTTRDYLATRLWRLSEQLTGVAFPKVTL